MRIYLSGARKDFDKDEFCRVADILQEFGHSVVDAKLSNPDKKLVWYYNISNISTCDAVAMLDGWEDCKACRVESTWADYIGIQCSGWRDYVEVVA